MTLPTLMPWPERGRARCWLMLSALLAVTLLPVLAEAADNELAARVQSLTTAHPGKTGAYVLEKGEESLLARAWLTDHAAHTIDVQYFIWSTDNIGILAAEALLRAADRGTRVRVLVDDLLIDAGNEHLLALAEHANVHIRIYNPKHSVGVSTWKRLLNIATEFRSVNQRMHDKTFIVDGRVAILGGRNLADEYYDYDHAYNFRDRDILLVGEAVGDMQSSFERFWQSELAVPVQVQLAEQLDKLGDAKVAEVYAGLHAYAGNTDNFAPEVRLAIRAIGQQLEPLIDALVWDDVEFISDTPGKNPGHAGLGGGGRTTQALVDLLDKAQQRVVIQSPYLVMPDGGIEFFRQLVARGVDVRISTNSLASTDNLEAFSGYSKQRRAILAAGIDVYEFKPAPEIQRTLIDRYQTLEKNSPVFAVHAKSMVIDGSVLFVGTFNLDPRSANLNTEVGVVIRNRELAAQVEASILEDMQAGNSWNARSDNPDAYAPLAKRLKLPLLELLPLDPLL